MRYKNPLLLLLLLLLLLRDVAVQI